MSVSTPEIAIIGGGLGGMCMAIQLRQAGYQKFTVFEKADTIGGTWRDNRYPGLACDVPSHLYSYSFELNPQWSHAYSPGWEIQAYCEHCADKYGIRPHIRVNSDVRRCEFVNRRWQITTADGMQYSADILVGAMGGLHLPHLPDIEGRDSFSGPAFHSARWQDINLDAKRVAIIGSAASAVQIVPAIAGQLSQLTVFQRTPNWIIPRRDRAYSRFSKWCFSRVPGVGRAYRWLLYWVAESRWPAFRHNSFANRAGRLLGLMHLRRQVSDKTLREKLTPDYPMGCKRILRSDDYYPALQRDNVELATSAIARIEPDAVVTQDGRRHVVDVIVYATGFDVFDITGATEIVNQHKRSLREHWGDGISAHRTMAVPGFPNFFMLQGPNSALGHNSVIFMIEAQVRYIVACIGQMQSLGWATIEARPDALEAYQQSLVKDLDKMIWSAGCNSWYQDSTGRVFTLWPRTSTRYWQAMRRPDMTEYREAV